MEKWKKTSEEILYKRYRTLLKKTFILPNGLETDFDIMDEPQAVGILALTPSENVILCKMFRPGPEEIVEDLPSGFLEKGEDPLECAKRELLEETGYTGEFEYVCHLPVDDAYRTISRHCVIARNCKRVTEQELEPEEHIEVIEKSVHEFRNQLKEGKITAPAVAYRTLDHLNFL